MHKPRKRIPVELRPHYRQKIEDHLRKQNGLAEYEAVKGMTTVIKDILGKVIRGELKYVDGREYFG